MAETNSHQSVKTYLSSNWLDTLCYLFRIVTIISCVIYIFGSLFGSPYVWYQRALIANAATSALRLHQRIGQQNFGLRFSPETVQMLLSEDSMHYLLFSIIFLFSSPLTVALAPISFFAAFHVLRFTLTLLNLRNGDGVSPSSSVAKARSLISKALQQSDNMLRIVAVHEILLMLIAVVLAFSSGYLLLPIVYYHFLKLRYASRRNPYSRRVFYELRVTFTHLANHANCPQLCRTAIFKAIDVICFLAPTSQ